MVRSRRITGSTCGKILKQKEPTPALLQRILYPKAFTNLPLAVKWGIDHEPHANRAYLQYAKKHGKRRLTTKKLGSLFILRWDFLVPPLMLVYKIIIARLQKALQNLNVLTAKESSLWWKLAATAISTAITKMAVFA